MDRELIVGTIADIELAIAEIMARQMQAIAQLEAELAAPKGRLAVWRKCLEEIDGGGDGPAPPQKKKRLPKNHIFGALRACLRSAAESGLSLQDISSQTSLPTASCSRVLRRYPAVFVKGEQELWTLVEGRDD